MQGSSNGSRGLSLPSPLTLTTAQRANHHRQTNIQLFTCPSCRPTNSVEALTGKSTPVYAATMITLMLRTVCPMRPTIIHRMRHRPMNWQLRNFYSSAAIQPQHPNFTTALQRIFPKEKYQHNLEQTDKHFSTKSR